MGRIKETVSKIGRILGYTGIATMLSGPLVGCSSDKEIVFGAEERYPVTYAIPFIALGERECHGDAPPPHPVDKNGTLVSAVNVRDGLVK